MLFGCFLSALLLRLHPLARSYIASVTFTGFGICAFLRSVLWLQMRSLRQPPAESSRVRVRAYGLRFSAGSQQLHPRRLPSRLTSRSSRPRVVASAMCFTLRLHMSAAPPQGGLTQALGGRKALELLVFQHGDFTGFGWRCSSVSSSARCFFGYVRVARSHIVCVALAGFGNGVWRRHVLHC